jgi:hypothetical protein
MNGEGDVGIEVLLASFLYSCIARVCIDATLFVLSGFTWNGEEAALHGKGRRARKTTT